MKNNFARIDTRLTMSKFCILWVLMLCNCYLFAQINLVPDSSFEVQNGRIYNACKGVHNDSFTKYLKYWNNPTDGTPDLYSYNYFLDGYLKPPLFDTLKEIVCYGSYVGGFGPSFKSFFVFPKSGNSFSGLWYAPVYTSGLNYRYYKEFIQTELVNTLNLNTKYKVGFSSVVNPWAYQRRSIDFLFSDSQILNKNVKDCYIYPYCTGFKEKFMPQISFSNFDSFQYDTGIWQTKETVFRNVKPDMKWLTIGSFRDTLLGKEIWQHQGSYFFLDDVFVHELPCIVGPDTVCYGQQVVLNTTLGMPYYWSRKADGSDTLSIDSTYSFVANTDRKIYAFGYKGIDSLLLKVIKHPAYPSFKDTILACAGDTIRINAFIANCMYKWSTGSHSAAIDINSTGSYVVEITNYYGCKDTLNTYVQFHKLPEITLDNTYTLCELANDSIVLDAGNHFACNWQPSNSVICKLIVDMAGKFELIITDDLKCKSKKRIEVINACDIKVFIPNAIHIDGINKTFVPVVSNVKNIELQIFNRWGELLYKAEGEKVEWDGKYQDEYCMPGLYFYIIEVESLNGGESNFYKGSIRVFSPENY